MTLAELRAAAVLSALDVELSRGLGGLAGETREDVLLAVALASRATRDGHVCADLGRLAGTELRGPTDGEVLGHCPALEGWRSQVATSPLVGQGGDETPLVLDARDWLYLRRLWVDEQRLARALRERSGRPVEPRNPAALRSLLRSLFENPGAAPDWQRIAATVAAVSSLTVVSGGPGTGKTTTATKIIALLVADLLSAEGHRPRVLLLAPTGKAAARLAESVAASKANLRCDPEILDRIPAEARTVHRALEVDREGRFRVDRERPLFADVVVVDEASMIDVALMRRLVEAVPPRARLVLLGDRYQLSSVEAGAVLADICGDPARAHYSPELDARLTRTFDEPLPAANVGARPFSIDDSVVTLKKSFRFDERSALGALSVFIQRGDVTAVLTALESDGAALLVPAGDGLDPRLIELAVSGFEACARSSTPEQALDALSRFRVLLGNRQGPLGVESANAEIELALREHGLLGRTGVVHPVLIHRNDPSLELFNGDVGIVFREGGTLRAVFRRGDGTLRSLSPSRLPPHEPAFAMSVHKSQGSEFDEVAVVLPREGSPLLTRELLYTAVTRARLRAVVHATEAAVREAVGRPALRASGLAEALRFSAD